MSNSKIIQINKFIENLKLETQVEEIIAQRNGKPTNVGLVNHYKMHDFIPNKWFDWVSRVDSQIMIIGQDWGPYQSLLKYVEDYDIEKVKEGFNYKKFLFKTMSSRTEKFIINSVQDTYKNKFNKEFEFSNWDNFIFTVAVFFTRQGKLFRGNSNFDPVRSLSNSFPYLSKQIDIIKPKIIMPLGTMAWESVIKHFNFQPSLRTLTEVMNNLPQEGCIKVNDTYIIPNFHPASYVDPKIMVKQFSRIWEINNSL
jgi:hypothetical protein